MNKNLKYKSLILSLSFVLTSCSASVNILDSNISIDSNISKISNLKTRTLLSEEEIIERDKEYNFSTKALSVEYFKRKLQKLIGSDNGSANGLKIVKELEYARIKGESKIPAQAMFTSDSTFHTTLTSVSAVVTERTGNSPFHVFLGGSSIPSNVILVKNNASGSNNGTSWTNAYTSLQTALTNATSGKEIWVSAGTYKPGIERADTFTLKDGVAIYGGFSGNETERTQRNWTTNVTILSGDLDNSNTASANDSFIVVTGASGGTIDGFTVKNGYGGGGGGMNNWLCSPIITNMIFSDNYAYYGGGMANQSASPILTNVTFSNNTAYDGGGMYNNTSNPVLTNVTFSNNIASHSGGGIYNIDSSPVLTNITYSGNTPNNIAP